MNQDTLNLTRTNRLIQKGLLKSVFKMKNQQDKEICLILFPEKTQVLQQKYTPEQIKEMDRMYHDLLFKSRYLLMVRIVEPAFQEPLQQMGYLPNATFVIPTKDYKRMTQEEQGQFEVIDPAIFIQEQFNLHTLREVWEKSKSRVWEREQGL